MQEDAFCETEQGSEAAAGANTASVETAVIQAQDAGVGTQDASCYDDADDSQEREDEDDDKRGASFCVGSSTKRGAPLFR